MFSVVSVILSLNNVGVLVTTTHMLLLPHLSIIGTLRDMFILVRLSATPDRKRAIGLGLKCLLAVYM